MNPGFWNRKNVLITGYEGFLGSNLTKFLLPVAKKTVGLDIVTERKNTLLSKDDYRKITVIKGSVNNLRLVKNIIFKHDIKVIFHLAAEAIVGRSWQNPLRTFSTNIKGTWNILEACRGLGAVDAIIIASSDKAYGSHRKLPYREDTPLIGKNPYDVSKSCADLIAAAYYHTYGVPVAITRCGNIYGPGDFNFSRIVPDAIRCAISGKTLYIRSDGKFTRDYVYIEDILNGYIFLAEKFQGLELGAEAFNFSDENPITVMEIVRKIYKIAGRRPDYKILNQAGHEIKHQYLSSRKARKILDWKPGYALDEGLFKTISWYKNLRTDLRV